MMNRILLTDDQMISLYAYLRVSKVFCDKHLQECRDLVEDINDFGSVKFPNMEDPASFWEKVLLDLGEMRCVMSGMLY